MSKEERFFGADKRAVGRLRELAVACVETCAPPPIQLNDGIAPEDGGWERFAP